LLLPTFYKDCAVRLYVGRLSFETVAPQFEAPFATPGQVTSVHLACDRETRPSRGFGFVEMADAARGHAACAGLDQHEFDGGCLTVNEAKPQQKRRVGGFAGRGPRRDARW
jgi:RNA recognition motif-containing protein